MEHHMHDQSTMSREMQECIQNCKECHATCMETVTHCLQMGGKHAEASHILVMLDCAEMCATSENFMLRNSPLHHRTCGVCADACEACARSCEMFEGDEMMQRCAEMCHRCADSCNRMETMATRQDKNSTKM